MCRCDGRQNTSAGVDELGCFVFAHACLLLTPYHASIAVSTFCVRLVLCFRSMQTYDLHVAEMVKQMSHLLFAMHGVERSFPDCRKNDVQYDLL